LDRAFFIAYTEVKFKIDIGPPSQFFVGTFMPKTNKKIPFYVTGKLGITI